MAGCRRAGTFIIAWTNTAATKGGKVKPLKAPKREKVEDDDDTLAFKANQKAGTIASVSYICGYTMRVAES